MYTPLQNSYQAQAPDAIRRMRILMLWFSAVCYGLYALILAPLYTQLASNSLHLDAVYTIVLGYFLDALDLAVFFVIYPATVYAIWRGGLSKAYSIPLIFSLMTLGKYMLNFFMTCLTDGGFPAFDIFWERDIPIIAPAFLLEIFQYGLVVLISGLIRHARMKKYQEEMFFSRAPYDERSLAFPLVKIFSYKSAVQWTAFWSSVVVLLGRLFMHGIYQLTLLVYNGQSDSLTVIAIDVVSDILIATVLYFVFILLLSYFDRKDMERLASASVSAH